MLKRTALDWCHVPSAGWLLSGKGAGERLAAAVVEAARNYFAVQAADTASWNGAQVAAAELRSWRGECDRWGT